jgi:DNA-binding MarR family transcriptional regulator
MSAVAQLVNPNKAMTSQDAIDHIGVDLWRAFRSYELAMFERVAERGFDDIVVSDSDVLIHIAMGGTRLADIAKRRGLSKQAVHERVHSLIARGYLNLVGDPEDRRSKIVRFTARGAKMIDALKDVKRGLHEEIQAVIGIRRMSALRNSLGVIETIVRRPSR